jgi:CheY-like chemotaxis protein
MRSCIKSDTLADIFTIPDTGADNQDMPAVLVLEDDPSVCSSLCTMLTLSGYTAHPAQTVDEALAILKSKQVDAVTLDVRVPDPKGLERSGLSLLRTLRATPGYASLPVLIFTGMPLSREEEEAAHRLHAPVFYKPQPYSVLIQHLNRQLHPRPPRRRLDH